MQADSVMKLAVMVLLPLSTVAAASGQTKPTPKAAVAKTDNCAPIGRTAGGQLVYSMKCDNLPAPSAPSEAQAAPAVPPQAEPAAEEPIVERSGLFGLSYTVKQPGQ